MTSKGLLRLRKQLKLPQTRMAEMLGFSLVSYQRQEKGRLRISPRMELAVEKLARLVNPYTKEEMAELEKLNPFLRKK